LLAIKLLKSIDSFLLDILSAILEYNNDDDGRDNDDEYDRDNNDLDDGII
jgi:hypothetical protein